MSKSELWPLLRLLLFLIAAGQGLAAVVMIIGGINPNVGRVLAAIAAGLSFTSALMSLVDMSKYPPPEGPQE